ncbi:MAG: UbiA family prenyltransferase [candidate division Zixibacteria bacterium]|nr:UbiA family prenyltransferase [candidate division Zixibacteria bacterium]
MRFLDYIFAARPLLIMPVWSVFLVSLHYHHQLTGNSFQIVDLVNLVCLSLLFSGALFINQVYDYRTDLINKKVGFLQKNIITPKAMMLSYLTVSLVPIAAGGFLSTVILGLYLQIFLIGYIYSAPPLRLKDRTVTSLLANGYTYGFLVALTVFPGINFHNAGLLGWDNPFYFFFTIISITCVTTLPDIEGDRATGKKTVAVVIGRSGTLLLALIFMLAAVYTAFNSAYDWLAYLATVGAVLIFAALIVKSEKLILLTAKLPLLLVTLLAAFFYPLYLLFIVALLLLTRIYYKKRFNLIYPELA